MNKLHHDMMSWETTDTARRTRSRDGTRQGQRLFTTTSTTYKCSLPPIATTLPNASSMLSTAKVVSTAILPGLSASQARIRQPSGTWMNAPLSVPPLRNMWMAAGLPLIGEGSPVDEAGEGVSHSQSKTAV